MASAPHATHLTYFITNLIKTTKRIMNKSILLLSPLLAAAASLHGAVVVDFNSGSELANSFSTTGTALAQVASGGLNNSGAIDYSASDVNGFSTINLGAVTYNTSADFTLTQSAYFKTEFRTDTFERDGRRALQLGLTEASSVTYSGGGLVGETSLTAGIYVRDAFQAGTPDTMTVDFFASTTNPDANFQLTNVGLSLLNDSWYFLTIDYNYVQATDNWQIVWTLNNSASDGTVGSLVGSQVSSTNGANIFGANPDLVGYFGTRSAQRTSIGLIDNVSLVAVPEPSTYAALTGLLALGLVMWRRRS